MALNPHLRWAWAYSGNGQPEPGSAGSGPVTAALVSALCPLVDEHVVLAVDLLVVGEVEAGLVQVREQELADAAVALPHHGPADVHRGRVPIGGSQLLRGVVHG